MVPSLEFKRIVSSRGTMQRALSSMASIHGLSSMVSIHGLIIYGVYYFHGLIIAAQNDTARSCPWIL